MRSFRTVQLYTSARSDHHAYCLCAGSTMAPNREPTWRWTALPPALRTLARAELARELREDLGMDPSSAHILALLLPELDMSWLAVDARECAELVGVNRWQPGDWHAEGALPHMVVKATDGHTHARVYWRCIAQAWGDWRRDHDRPMGRGARYWPT